MRLFRRSPSLRKIKQIDAGNPGYLPEYTPRKAAELTSLQLASFRRALDAGVPIAMGTDLGPYEHFQNGIEFGFMVEGGMTPMQAILAGTKMAANCIGMGSDIGTLAPGMMADLLILDGNPLDDIQVLAEPGHLRMVMQGGAVVSLATDRDTTPSPGLR